MPKRLPRKSKVAIIFDTSCLFTHSDYISSKIIDKAIAFGNRLSIEIYIPEIVLMELEAHCSKRVKDKHDKIIRNTDYINKIINRNINKYKSIAEIVKVLSKNIKKWVSDNKIKVLSTPYSALNIENIVNEAINKESVFRDKKSDSFKDYLILKTIEYHIDNIKYKSKIFFVSHDEVLTEEVDKLFQQKVNREALYTEEELLLERLAIVADKISKKKFDKIKQQASLIFFDKDSKQGFWYDKIRPYIFNAYLKEIEDPNEGITEPHFFPRLFSDTWSPIDSGTFYIGPSTLVDTKLKGSKYPFQTKITYRQKFQKEIPHLPNLSSGSDPYKLSGDGVLEALGKITAPITSPSLRSSDEVQHTMEVVFICKWTAKNPKGLKLIEPELQNIKLTEKERPPSTRVN